MVRSPSNVSDGDPRPIQKQAHKRNWLPVRVVIRFRDQASNIPVVKDGLVSGAKLCSYCRSEGDLPGPCCSMLLLEKRIGIRDIRCV